jgi:UPF0716 protein FxsA
MYRYIAALLLVPLLDSLFLVLVATQIGAPLTVLIVVLTALLGMLLVRAEGRHTIRTIQQKLAQGEIPTNELLDGGLLLVAGALTLTPGLVTDALGILLVFPLTRMPIRAVLRDYVVVPYIDERTGGFATGNVYVGGFPFDDDGSGDAAGAGVGPMGPGGLGGSGGESGTAEGGDDAYDLHDDAYEIEWEDEDGDGDGDGDGDEDTAR